MMSFDLRLRWTVALMFFASVLEFVKVVNVWLQ